MKGIIGLLLLFAVHGTSWAASWETHSFRTDRGGLVRIGMSAESANRELGAHRIRTRGHSGKRKGEVWVYRGNDGLYRVTIIRGQVARIVVTPNRD